MSDAIFTGQDLACLRGGRTIFTGLSFRLEAAGALLITGPNGSGKSSLLRVMAGLLQPLTGRVAWQRTPNRGSAGAEQPIGYVGHADAVKARLSVRENLAFWAALAQPRAADARTGRALDEWDLSRLAELPGQYLSAGQRRRLALARLSVAPAQLWLLDEPTVSLDRAAIDRLEAAIARHRGSGGMVALATHAPINLPDAATLDLGDLAAVAEPIF